MGSSRVSAAEPPATAKGGRTRERIIDAAAELIHSRGATATTLLDVRAAAQVSSSQLYHYFADKQALVRAVVELQGDRIVDAYEAAQITSLRSLRAWREELVGAQRAQPLLDGCPLGSLAAELAETDPTGRDIAAAEFERWRTAIASGLRHMQAAGELRRDASPDDLSLALLAALQGGLLLSKVRQSNEPLRRALDAMIAVIELNGLSDGGRPQGV